MGKKKEKRPSWTYTSSSNKKRAQVGISYSVVLQEKKKDLGWGKERGTNVLFLFIPRVWMGRDDYSYNTSTLILNIGLRED